MALFVYISFIVPFSILVPLTIVWYQSKSNKLKLALSIFTVDFGLLAIALYLIDKADGLAGLVYAGWMLFSFIYLIVSIILIVFSLIKENTKTRIIGVFITLFIYVIGATACTFAYKHLEFPLVSAPIREYINKQEIKEKRKRIENDPNFIEFIDSNEFTEAEVVELHIDRGFGYVFTNIDDVEYFYNKDFGEYGDEFRDEACPVYYSGVVCSDNYYLGKFLNEYSDDKHLYYYWTYEPYYDGKKWKIEINNNSINAKYENDYDDEIIYVYEQDYDVKEEWFHDTTFLYKTSIKEGIENNTETIIIDRIDARTLKKLTPKG